MGPVAAAVASFAAAGFGWRPGLLHGVGVGLSVGAAYSWLLWRRTQSAARLPARAAAAAARIGAVARFVFVLCAFAVAGRLWPGMAVAWAAGAFLVPLAVHMVALVREVGD